MTRWCMGRSWYEYTQRWNSILKLEILADEIGPICFIWHIRIKLLPQTNICRTPSKLSISGLKMKMLRKGRKGISINKMRISYIGNLKSLFPNRPISPPMCLQSVENSTINNPQAIIGYSEKITRESGSKIFINNLSALGPQDALSSIDCRTLEEEEGCINYANDLNTKLNWKMRQKLFSTTFWYT